MTHSFPKAGTGTRAGTNPNPPAGRRRVLLGFLAALVLAAGPAPSASAADDARGLVLVAGATGRTGRLVVTELKAQGYGVRALVRDPAAAGDLGDGVAIVQGDVRDPATLRPALAGATAVISALGSTRKGTGNGPEQVDYQGIANLAAAAAAAGARQIVVVSSAGVTQEDHPLNRMFDNVLRWKAKGEDAVRASGLAYTIVRPGGLTDKPGGQVAVRLEQGDRGSGFIPRADVARIAVAALASPAARNRTFEAYSGTGAPPATPADWDALFGALKADGTPPAAP